MTSAEFTAKYRVLKTITERGARSQIAQETALGRMVMLHHLDVGTSAERQRLVARLGSLDEESAAKVFDVVTVDGTQVIVTHYLATFTDLPSWIEQHAISGDAPTVMMQAMPRPHPAAPPSAPTPPSSVPIPPPPAAGGGFTSIFGPGHDAPSVPPPPPLHEPPPRPASIPTAGPPPMARTASSPGAPPLTAPTPSTPARGASFTDMFGAAQPPEQKAAIPPAVPPAPPAPPATPVRPASVPPTKEPGDFTRVFQGLSTPPAMTPPAPAPAPLPSVATPSAMPAAPPAPAPPMQQGEGFTQVFGKLATPPVAAKPVLPAFASAPPSPPSPPAPPSAPRYDSVMPPAAPYVPPPPPQPAPAPASGDFTQLFSRLDPQAAATPTPSYAPPPAFAPPAPPPPPFAPPSAPAPAWQPPATPSMSAPPVPSWQAPASVPPMSAMPAMPQVQMPTPPASPLIPPIAGASAGGPSEFTRVLRGMPVSGPVMPPAPVLPPAPQPRPVPTPVIAPQMDKLDAASRETKSYLPLIIALNVILVGAIVLVVFLVMKK